jgi:actin-related protein
MVQLIFEQFGVQGVHVADAATLSLFAHGKLSGLAVDCGAGTIGALPPSRRERVSSSFLRLFPDICPVFEGAPLTHAARQMRLGGQDQSELLRELAGGAGVPLDLAQAEAAKEALCAVAESSDVFETLQSGAGSAAGSGSQFTLPDGRSVQLPAHALSRVAELPFTPPVGAGIAEEVLASMQLIGVEQRKAMLETIVLSGGMRGMAGFEPRLVRELGAAALYARPAAVQPPEYMVPCTASQAAFMGGSILAKTVFPLNQYMTRAEYEERGPMYRRL